MDVGGEILTIDGWPDGLGAPPGPVTVSGEVVAFELLGRVGAGTENGNIRTAAKPSETPSVAPAEVRGPEGSTPVLPPMPGKVVEVRVTPGQRVRRGDVLLVLEAMKMRNEVVSPRDGEVADLSVAAGDNATARRPLLYIRPPKEA